MIELLAVGVFLAAGITLLGTRASAYASVSTGTERVIELTDADGNDLPCPWCQGPTRETDSSCSSCGQPFG